MTRQHRAVGITLGLGLAAMVPMATASATSPSAQAVFDAASDTSPQLAGGETTPRGPATYTPSTNGRLTLNAQLTGLTPLTQYVVVAYKDGACIPTPGVTAFPSPVFTTGTTGAATLTNYPVNPAALNPLGTLNVNEINSVSIRQVVTTVLGTTVPDATQTEGCDTSISH